MFSWEAFATILAGILAFVAGVGAIIGAVFVGKRQVNILDQQAKIANKALEIEELKIRVEIFEKRLAVYDATRDWINFILMYARAPGRPTHHPEEPREREIARTFYEQMDRARFLFRPEVYIRLTELFSLSSQLRIHQGRARRAIEDADIERHLDAEHNILNTISTTSLSNLFGNELNLSIYGATHGDRIEESTP
ncbi:hypothetical protein D3C85_1095210 [compost metagenome]